MELNAFAPLDQCHAGQATHEVVVPEPPPKFAVGYGHESQIFLQSHGCLDGFHSQTASSFGMGRKSIRTYAVSLMLPTRIVYGARSQQTAHMVRAKRRR